MHYLPSPAGALLQASILWVMELILLPVPSCFLVYFPKKNRKKVPKYQHNILSMLMNVK